MIPQDETEITQTNLRFPSELWKRARRLSIELKPPISANQMVVQGLAKILPRFEAQLDKQQRESQNK